MIHGLTWLTYLLPILVQTFAECACGRSYPVDDRCTCDIHGVGLILGRAMRKCARCECEDFRAAQAAQRVQDARTDIAPPQPPVDPYSYENLMAPRREAQEALRQKFLAQEKAEGR